MIIINCNYRDIKIHEELSVALGTFDGVHRGHQKIIEQAVLKAKEKKIKSAVFTFNNHPYSIIRPDKNLHLITDNEAKAQLIQNLGVDYLFFVDFDKEFSRLDYIDFIKFLKKNLNAKVIVCGYNYTFGNNGSGNPVLLKYYEDILNYEVKVIEKVTYRNKKISSSIIRELLTNGKISEANMLLGYNYFFYGEVIQGKELANKLGFPTANIKLSNNLCIKNGVYITLTRLNDKLYPSITNIGYTPTVENKFRVAETHLLNFSGDLYGAKLKVELLNFIREEKKFDSIESLKRAVLDDIKSAEDFFSNNDIYIK
jgi:riboflavin kinase/FMN adenylyltransferase